MSGQVLFSLSFLMKWSVASGIHDIKTRMLEMPLEARQLYWGYTILRCLRRSRCGKLFDLSLFWNSIFNFQY